MAALTSEDLIEEDLDVVGGERLRRHDHFVEVALHQLRDHVAARRLAVKERWTSAYMSTTHLRAQASFSVAEQVSLHINCPH